MCDCTLVVVPTYWTERWAKLINPTLCMCVQSNCTAAMCVLTGTKYNNIILGSLIQQRHSTKVVSIVHFGLWAFISYYHCVL